MDFIPLAIWSVGFLLASCFEERTHYQRGLSHKEVKELCAVPNAQFFLLGFGVFLLLGAWAHGGC